MYKSSEYTKFISKNKKNEKKDIPWQPWTFILSRVHSSLNVFVIIVLSFFKLGRHFLGYNERM